MKSNLKIGRNDKCHCGSGKKYKKCCIHKDLYKIPQPIKDVYSEISDTTSKIVSNYSNFTECIDIPIVKSIKSLPNNIINDIKKYNKKYPSKMGECYNNSCLLSLNIDDVNVVYGYYSIPFIQNFYFRDLENLDFETCLNKLKSFPFLFNIVDINNEFIEVSYSLKGGGKFFIQPEKNIFWCGHCWNEYDGKYFDTTVETHRIKGEFPYWIEYRMGMTKSTSQIFSSSILKQFYTESIYN